jgi:hypothetical protein
LDRYRPGGVCIYICERGGAGGQEDREFCDVVFRREIEPGGPASAIFLQATDLQSSQELQMAAIANLSKSKINFKPSVMFSLNLKHIYGFTDANIEVHKVGERGG